MQSQMVLYSDIVGGFTAVMTKGKYIITMDSLQNQLGKGQFGIVYKVTNEDGQSYALKKIDVQSIEFKEIIFRELTYMEQLNQIKDRPNVVYAVDSAFDGRYLYIVMPLFDCGTLTSIINKGLITTEIQALEYFRQICYGIKTLHSINLIHRDLKSDNILASTYNDDSYPYHHYLSIGDLGIAKFMNDKDLTKAVGTKLTRAPEVDSGLYDFRADIYSLGCIFYKMLTKAEPFQGTTIAEVSVAQNVEMLKVVGAFSSPLSKLTLLILEGCLQYSKENRFTMADLTKLLMLDELYSNYSTLTLPDADSSQLISLNKVTRKLNYKEGIKIDSNPPKKHYKMQIKTSKCNIPIQHNDKVLLHKEDDLMIKVPKLANIAMNYSTHPEKYEMVAIPYYDSFKDMMCCFNELIINLSINDYKWERQLIEFNKKSYERRHSNFALLCPLSPEHTIYLVGVILYLMVSNEGDLVLANGNKLIVKGTKKSDLDSLCCICDLIEKCFSIRNVKNVEKEILGQQNSITNGKNMRNKNGDYEIKYKVFNK